mmetsp:Transcript_33678/g.74582  ORF Transcript_33678/g.74582 Transcript_33678/m.74582 type:complete len:165 (+) Transcript_33678:139-633(+)
MAPHCFNLYIYNRQGVCIHYQEWYRPKHVTHGAGTLLDDQKQMFGLFWTLSNLCATVDPKCSTRAPLGAPRKIGEGSRFNSFTTNNYKLHFFETATGFKIVLNTSREAGDMRELLSTLYDDLFVEHVVKNPAYTPGTQVSIDSFNAALNAFFKARGMIQSQQQG